MILCFPAKHLDFFSSEGCLSLHPLQSSLCRKATQDTCRLESTLVIFSIYAMFCFYFVNYGVTSEEQNEKLILYVFLELDITPLWRAWCVLLRSGSVADVQRVCQCLPLHFHELRRTNTLDADEKHLQMSECSSRYQKSVSAQYPQAPVSRFLLCYHLLYDCDKHSTHSPALENVTPSTCTMLPCCQASFCRQPGIAPQPHSRYMPSGICNHVTLCGKRVFLNRFS